MNKHILLVMRWLKDKDSVSQEELEKNRREAYAATDANLVGAWAAAYAAASAYHVGNDANYWVNRYFEETGEDKNKYLKELEK